jgi:hypothetical protein
MNLDDAIKIIVPVICALIGAISPVVVELIRASKAFAPGENQKHSGLVYPPGYQIKTIKKQRFNFPWKWVLGGTFGLGLFSYLLVSIILLPKTNALGIIPFNSALDSRKLDADLLWQPGNSELSGYTLSRDSLSLTAGPGTWPNFPEITYTRPLEGDFEVQVRLNFTPPSPELKTAQMVGFIIRPINTDLIEGDTQFPEDWAVAAKYLTDAGSLAGCRGGWADYDADIVYLKLARQDNHWRCAYSENGANWSELAIKIDDQSLSSKPLEMSLFAYSITKDAITVKFSEWHISQK